MAEAGLLEWIHGLLGLQPMSAGRFQFNWEWSGIYEPSGHVGEGRREKGRGWVKWWTSGGTCMSGCGCRGLEGIYDEGETLSGLAQRWKRR